VRFSGGRNNPGAERRIAEEKALRIAHSGRAHKQHRRHCAGVHELSWLSDQITAMTKTFAPHTFDSSAGESRLGYLLAVHTGLRRSELRALQWKHIHLNKDGPIVILDGQFTKNGKDAKIPLHPEIAQELRACKPASAKPNDFVLTGKMLPSMWKMKRDLKKAAIEYEDNEGRRADFHSLRHTLATNLAPRNIAPRVAMEILRHSDIRLTMNLYTDASLLPVADAIGKLWDNGYCVQQRTKTPTNSRHWGEPAVTV
jgi:integrase